MHLCHTRPLKHNQVLMHYIIVTIPSRRRIGAKKKSKLKSTELLKDVTILWSRCSGALNSSNCSILRLTNLQYKGEAPFKFFNRAMKQSKNKSKGFHFATFRSRRAMSSPERSIEGIQWNNHHCRHHMLRRMPVCEVIRFSKSMKTWTVPPWGATNEALKAHWKAMTSWNSFVNNNRCKGVVIYSTCSVAIASNKFKRRLPMYREVIPFRKWVAVKSKIVRYRMLRVLNRLQVMNVMITLKSQIQ